MDAFLVVLFIIFAIVSAVVKPGLDAKNALSATGKRNTTDATHQTARYAAKGYDTQNLDFCDSFISRSRGISFADRPANMDELTYLAKCNAQREKEIETQMRHKHFDE